MNIFLKIFFIFSFVSVQGIEPCEARPSPSPKKLIKILSIDGGGVVGIVPATILAFIEKHLQNKKNLSECFDLMAGTSTGGLIVFMLSTPNAEKKPRYTAEEVLNTYVKLAPQIFEQSFFQWLTSLDGWIDEKYSPDNFEEILKQYIGDTRLSETLTHVLIPAYDVLQNKTIYFTSDHARTGEEADFYVRDVARATAAAPTYFAPAHIRDLAKKRSYTVIDGGIAVQNPALAALLQAVKIFGKNQDFLLISLGAGDNYGDPEDKKITAGGKLQWAGKIVPLFMSASSDIVTSQIQALSVGDASRQYYRFQVILRGEGALLDNTDPENIKALQELGTNLVRRHQKELQQIIALLDND